MGHYRSQHPAMLRSENTYFHRSTTRTEQYCHTNLYHYHRYWCYWILRSRKQCGFNRTTSKFWIPMCFTIQYFLDCPFVHIKMSSFCKSNGDGGFSKSTLHSRQQQNLRKRRAGKKSRKQYSGLLRRSERIRLRFERMQNCYKLVNSRKVV